MRKLFLLICLLLNINLFAQNFYPQIKTLSSKDELFKQYSQDVEINYKKLAKEEEPYLFFYKYTATKDDSLLSIAARCNIPYETIATVNKIVSIHSRISGIALLLPTVPGIFIAKNPQSNIEKIIACRNFDSSRNLCYNINNDIFFFVANERFNSTERIFFLEDRIKSPLPEGILSSTYGLRVSPITGKKLFHNGIDLAAELGTSIQACLTGSVKDCGYDSVYGNYIIIAHDNNIESFYAHLESFNIKKGDFVFQGDVIGYVGMTGLTTGPHLHFEVYVSGQTKDPLTLIK